MKEHLKALLEKRNALAQELNTEGLAMQEKWGEVNKAHKSDCPCKLGAEVRGECTDTTYKEAMGDLNARVEAQKAKREQFLELESLIEAGSEIAEREIKDTSDVLPIQGAVTEGGMMQGIAAAVNKKKVPFLTQVGNDFHAFLNQQLKLTHKTDVKGRNVIGTAKLKNGDSFNRVASFHAIFGNQTEVVEATKTFSAELGLPETFGDAMKTRRDALTKSMFTQHPLAGGDGSLYAPTEVFPGNTGGLCEYIVDDSIEVLPYAPVSFLDCIPVRSIAKPYVLFVRQTLRVNNASGVGESVVLVGSDNPTEAPVTFTPLKPESEFGFSQAKAYTITYADTLAVSEEFLEDCPAVADAVQTQLLENVRQEFYDQVINGDGTDGEYPEIVGLLAQVGLSTRVHRGAATFFGNAMAAGAADDNTRETIERAIFDAQAYGYNVDCVIMSFDDYVEMTFLKDELGHRLYTDAELANIRGARITADVRMPAGTAIAGAFRQSVQIIIRRGIRLDIGWVDKQFRQDMLTLRATMRAGLMVKVPHALIRITGL